MKSYLSGMRMFSAMPHRPRAITHHHRALPTLLHALSLALFAFHFGPKADAATPQPGALLRVSAPAVYLPSVPILVRVEVVDPATGRPDRNLWDVDATLSTASPTITLSTNRVILRNGLGSALVMPTGSGDFNLTTTVGTLTTNRLVQSRVGVPVSTTGGTLSGNTTWSGVVQLTNTVTVPSGQTLTIESNTLVLINGVASGTGGFGLVVNGAINALGTEAHPITITCANANQRWGQIRHDNAAPSLYRNTLITRGGFAPGEGHTGQAPVVRPNNSTVTFENCSLTDFADASGTPGKIGYGINSDLTFRNCLFSRARMGPEIQGTALLFTNSWILEMRGPDDSDGIYLHDQQVGQQIRLVDSVVGFGDDDGVDTLSSDVTVENCIIRDWPNPNEDAKGISAFSRTVTVKRCLIVDCWVGVSAKTTAGSSATVNIENCTIIGISNTLAATFKANAPGPIVDIRVTNSILRGVDPIRSDFADTNFTIGYCALGESWPGTGNLTADPLFVNEAGKDFHLLVGSPAINSGNPNSPLDLDGSVVDLGFFPFGAGGGSGSGNSPPSTNTLVAANSSWRYLDTGSDPGTTWAARTFDDSSWPTGNAQFGYGDGDEATVVSFGPDPNNKFVTTYFRRTFVISDPTKVQSLLLSVLRDDGAVTYINGVEVLRQSMPAGPVTFQTLATTASEYPFEGTNFPGSMLVAGTNVIACEVHQGTASSSDVSFDLELFAVLAGDTNARPLIALTSPANGILVAAPASLTLAANASDPDGTVTNVAFFAGGTKIGDDATAPFSLAWNGVAAGSYSLSAIATDNTGLTATSAVVNVTVSTNTAPPAVLTKSPAPGNVSSLSQVTVSFSKPVTGVDATDLLVNGTPASSLSGAGSNYVFSFPQPPYGTVTISWAAGHGINDGFTPPAAFNGSGAGATWQYQLVDATPPLMTSLNPAPGAGVPSLTSVSVTFSESVLGVNASDLLVNSVPTASVAGSGAGPYVFSFTQPSLTSVQLAWVPGHGIQDATGNPFGGGSWSYTIASNAVGVILSEIMYHPSSENPLEEYIELYNQGGAPVSLAGWSFSSGIQFTFPSVILPAGGYLVVAANTNVFAAKYPGVTNVIGNWVGTLNNSGEDLDLDDLLGRRVDSVRYADEGDWAVRRRGANDPGTSGQPHRGWDWMAEHDGLGGSLELINVNLSNNEGQNWAASRVAQGTPGVPNSVRTNNIAPMILGTAHLPTIPTSADPILITAQILDESPNGLAVSVSYRADAATPPPFTTVNLRDDGTGGDVAAGDGLYSVSLPAQPNNTVVEFYLAATDAQGLTRTWPAPAIAAPDGVGPTGQVANALFQVDNTVFAVTNGQPLYKLIMTEAERAELASIPSQSNVQGPNAQMNGTFVSIDGAGVSLHYLASFRNRGHGSRTANPPNYHVAFRSDNRWKNVTGLNLNTRFVHLQHLGSILARKSGVNGAESTPAQVRVNNQNLAASGSPMFGAYAANEDVASEWAEHHYPNDPNGNIYRAVRDIAPPDFTYRGEDYLAYTNTYFKESNASENNWSDLIGMLRVVGINNATSFTTENVRQVVNVEQWLRHFAFMNIVNNRESGLNTGFNDDYFMYAGVDDPRFILTYWDLDTILGGGDSPGSTTDGLYTATGNNGSGLAMDRFLRWPDFEPIYFDTLRQLLNTVFAPTNFDALVDIHLGGYASSTAASIKSWMSQRRNFLLSAIPTNSAPVAPVATIAGTPRSPTPLNNATLVVGGANVVAYRFSLNGGAYSAETPVATPIVLNSLPAGTNRLAVIGRNAAGTFQTTNNATVRSWIVQPSWPAVRLNEVLAQNDSALNHFGTFPDAIELFNEGGASVDLSGLRLTDDASNPDKFTFPAGTTLAANSRLVVYANNPDGTAGFHLGFSLEANGESLYLFDRAANGNVILDSVTFGLQLSDRSIGRISGGDWVLTQPTFNAANIAQALGNPSSLRLNEWLASGVAPNPDDFIEIYNPDPLPVALAQLALTDQPIGAPARSPIADLSFIAGNGYRVFIADGQRNPANHVNFGLAIEQGEIGLMRPDGTVIDSLVYPAQRPGVASGRCPDGGLTERALLVPTPGSPNACPVAPPAPLAVNLIPLNNSWRYEESGTDLGTAWAASNYDDSTWLTGQALLGFDTNLTPPEPLRTPLTVVPDKITFYFRTHFNLPANLNVSELQLTHAIDDGAVFYLNGVEAGRFNMPAAAIANTTLASSSHEATTLETLTLNRSSLAAGDNVLAVEVHQNTGTSSDIVFGLRLDAIIVTNTPSLAGVVINEVLANNANLAEADGSKPDWIEIYNPSTSAVDLGDMSLSDDTLTPRRWVFPTGTLLPALGYRQVRLDADLPLSATNTGFGLKAAGGGVYLYNRLADGGGLASFVTYGLQAADFSLGRVPDGSTNWQLTLPTFGSANLIATLGQAGQLKVNEWMASPSSGDDWIEIYNPSPQPVELSGLWLSDALANPKKYQIPSRSYLGAGPEGFLRFWAANGNDADFTGFSLAGGGEDVVISTAAGLVIDGLHFNAQQAGVSEGRLPDASTNVVRFLSTPTPGNANFLPLANIVINEILTHTDPPLEDAIELFNPTGDDLNIGGWYLSDSQDNLLKFRIPTGTVVRAGRFHVFYESQFNLENPGTPFSFSSAKGDQVYLSQSITPGVLTGYRAFAEFDASENGVSFGRFQTSVGVDFTALSARTFGADNPATSVEFRTGTGRTNAYPRVGPIVINEIMYHQASTNDALEFVELHNLLGAPQPLFDPAHPLNTWRVRKGIDFEFPTNVTLPPGGYLVLVNFDPATDPASLDLFRGTYGTNVTLFGPYRGKLDNASEAIEIQKPDAPQTLPGPDFGLVPYIVVDRIVYADTAPWPTSPDGLGDSLKRANASLYGNDPANWVGGVPTPGAANSSSGVTNTAPALALIGNKSAIEGSLLTFTATATDAQVPGQTLTFSLDAGAPSAASITPTGTFTWIPGETDGPGSFSITVRVTDNGAPVLSDSETITVTVLETNNAPVLIPIGNKTGPEGTTVSFTATATDPDVPNQTLTFALDPGAPATATITAAGAFSWTPTEVDGPGVYPVTVRVTDSGVPARSTIETIQITVTEANLDPVLNPIGNRTVNTGTLLTFTATATDPDRPTNTLAFSLDAGAPAGSSISPGGVFTWTPSLSQGPSNYVVTVRVTDNGTPARSASETITIAVTSATIDRTLISLTNTWRYNTSGSNLLTAWREAAYDDSGWSLGAAVFQNETGSVIPGPTNTFLPLTNPAGQRITNYYFRARFFLPADVTGLALTASNLLDDGSVIYLNGIEAQRINMPAGPILATTFSSASWEANAFFVTNLSAAGLVPGENVIAVEVHQQSATSSDVVFGLSVTARIPTPNPIVITQAPTNLAVNAGGAAQFTVAVTGSTPFYQWFKNGSPLPGANGPTLNLPNVQAGDAGPYSVTVSNALNAVTAQATLTVNSTANSAPSLGGIGPRSVNEGATLTFTATATDPESPPQTLTFSLDAGAPAGATISPTGTFSWTPAETNGGNVYAVTIRVRDNGTPEASDFETFNITVNEINLPPTLAPLTNRTVSAGSTLAFTALAADPDLPVQPLTFSLQPGAPAGASIIAATGLFTWTPPTNTVTGTNVITVRVTDGALEDLKSFSVAVVGAPRITNIRRTSATTVAVDWTSFPGKTYRVQGRADLTPSGTWTSVGSAVTATGYSSSLTVSTVSDSLRFFRVVLVD